MKFGAPLLLGALGSVLICGQPLAQGLGAGTSQTLSVPATASPADSTADEWKWTVGFGLGLAPDYKGSEDYTAVPIPQVRVQKGRQYINLTGASINSNLLPGEYWRLGPSARFDKGRCDVNDSRVDDLKCQSDSFELGASFGFRKHLEGELPSFIDAGFEFLYDVAGASSGGTLVPKVTYFRALSEAWTISTGLSTTFGTEAYNSYHYGINHVQANDSGLDQANTDEGFTDAALKVAVGYEFIEDWDLGILAQYKRLFGDAGDSPVVDDRGDKNQFFGGILITHSF